MLNNTQNPQLNLDYTFLEFDSKHFGMNMGKISITDASCLSTFDNYNKLENYNNLLENITSIIKKEKLNHVTIKISNPLIKINNFLSSHGFYLTDINNIYLLDLNKFDRSMFLNKSKEIKDIILATKEDLVQLKHMAGILFSNSRFYNDPNLPLDKVSNMYSTWVESLINDSNSKIFICKDKNDIIGFITLTPDKSNNSAISYLIAVDPTYQGKHIGQQLMLKIIYYLTDKGISTLEIGTQFNNIPAINLYSRLGFKLKEQLLVMHGFFGEFHDKKA